MSKVKFKSRFTPEQKLLFAMGGVPAEYAQAWAEEKAAREAAQREQDIAEAMELCQKAQKEVVDGPCVGAEWVPGTYNTYPAALAVVSGKIYRYIHSGVCVEEDYLPLVGRYDGALLPGQVDPAIEAEKARIEAEKAEKAEKARLKAEAEKARIDAKIEAKRAARLAYEAERERAAAEARQARIDAAENAAKEKEAAKAAEAAAFRAASNPFAALAALKGGKL